MEKYEKSMFLKQRWRGPRFAFTMQGKCENRHKRTGIEKHHHKNEVKSLFTLPILSDKIKVRRTWKVLINHKLKQKLLRLSCSMLIFTFVEKKEPILRDDEMKLHQMMIMMMKLIVCGVCNVVCMSKNEEIEINFLEKGIRL
jgi:hypothetical protein